MLYDIFYLFFNKESHCRELVCKFNFTLYTHTHNRNVFVFTHTQAFSQNVSTIKSVSIHDTQTNTWLFRGTPISLDSIPNEHMYTYLWFFPDRILSFYSSHNLQSNTLFFIQSHSLGLCS
jgi:hypothetical protein